MIFDQINPMQIRIDDDRVVNALKSFLGVYYKFTHIGIIFPASALNDREQIFIALNEN